MSWRNFIADAMKLPPPPEPPPGEGRVMLFRAAPSYYRFRLFLWVWKQISTGIGLIAGIVFLQRFLDWRDWPPAIQNVVIAGEVFAWVTFVLQIPFSWMIMRLDYELRWYIVTDRSLRIREGILRVKEKTMAFANIQNIAVRQGPVQRLLGVADVEVRNAGGGGSSDASSSGGSHHEPMHVGYFRGVDNAAEIRDLLREGVRKQRNTGLGDPDDPEETIEREDPLIPALEILEHARASRAALQS